MTTKTLTLTDFLLARIAEDAEVVAGFEDWRGGDPLAGRPVPSALWRHYDGDHIVIGNARVLAECEAKRLIIAAHGVRVTMPSRPTRRTLTTTYYEGGQRDCSCGHNPCPTLAALAGIYADHPDYRQEWKP